MSLFRSRAVDFEEKWGGLRETIGRVVRLQTVDMTKWNDHYSYPALSLSLSLSLCVCVYVSSSLIPPRAYVHVYVQV